MHCYKYESLYLSKIHIYSTQKVKTVISFCNQNRSNSIRYLINYMSNKIKFLIICIYAIYIIGVILVQIYVNPEGYNYILFAAVPPFLYFFKDITSFKVGEFEIKKIQRDSKRTLATMYKSLLLLQTEKGGSGLGECNYFDDSKYKGFLRIAKNIKTSQKEINFGEGITKELSKSIKECAEILVQEIEVLIKSKLYDDSVSGKSALEEAEYAIKQLKEPSLTKLVD